ncbi:MAG: NAD(P)-binding oxidoreductase [Pseudomonadota bacterium]
MRILLLGATGRTGRRVLARLETASHQVVTYGRRPGGGTWSLTGPVDNVERLREACHGADAVLSCLASTNAEPVCSSATAALVASGVRIPRYVVASTAGIEMPGDARGPLDQIADRVLGLFLGDMLADRRAELEILQGSDLPWTVLRPPRLTNRPGRGTWRFDRDRPHTSGISRDDLAGALIEALGREDLIAKAPFVSEMNGERASKGRRR